MNDRSFVSHPLPAAVPTPVSMGADFAAAAFPLRDPVRIVGDRDASAELGALLTARTGLKTTQGASTSSTTGASTAGTERRIELRIEPGGPAESYHLAVDEASVVLSGADAAGLFYGVQTLGQLVSADGDGYAIPAVRIRDAPRFGYRGVMLDVARHFHPVETVKAYIDRASRLKFNALHLHLTDDQGWRVQLKSRPLLTELASGTSVGGDPGGFYTRDDYREIVGYAASRHMVVVPEVDLPGHTHAVGLAYPALAEQPVLSEEIRESAREDGSALPVAGAPYTGIAVGFSSLRIHEEATYDFVADVAGELAAMTPGPYLHIGGDEALGTSPADFALFMARATAIVADLGKTPVAWHEAGNAPDLAPSTVGQYWGFTIPTDGMDDTARTFADNGSRLILSPADAVYLDMKFDAESPLGLTWANGPTSVERSYDWDPAAIIDGVDDSSILGVEAPMWAETVRTLHDIDRLAYPRIAAAAEIAWSPAPGPDAPTRTWESFRERVGTLAPLWTGLGIRFHPSDEIPWVAE